MGVPARVIKSRDGKELIKDFQETNYPILSGKHSAQLFLEAGEIPTPQDVMG